MVKLEKKITQEHLFFYMVEFIGELSFRFMLLFCPCLYS